MTFISAWVRYFIGSSQVCADDSRTTRCLMCLTITVLGLVALVMTSPLTKFWGCENWPFFDSYQAKYQRSQWFVVSFNSHGRQSVCTKEGDVLSSIWWLAVEHVKLRRMSTTGSATTSTHFLWGRAPLHISYVCGWPMWSYRTKEIGGIQWIVVGSNRRGDNLHNFHVTVTKERKERYTMLPLLCNFFGADLGDWVKLSSVTITVSVVPTASGPKRSTLLVLRGRSA